MSAEATAAPTTPTPSPALLPAWKLPPRAPTHRRSAGQRRHQNVSVLAVCALLAVAAIWGSTYMVAQVAIQTMSVGDFLTWRFAIAALIVLALQSGAVKSLSAQGWRAGAFLGVALAAAYLLQTIGLRTTASSVSGFITGMLVVLTPLMAAVLIRERVSAPVWVAVALATGGLALLSLRGLTVGFGELLTLASATAFALHIVGTSVWAPRHDVRGLVVVQLLTVTLICAVVALPNGVAAPAHYSAWAAVVVTGVAATALAYFVQTWAQTHISATRVGVILTTEPVFAGLVGILVVGEQLSTRGALGAGFVLVGMLIATTQASSPRKRSSRRHLLVSSPRRPTLKLTWQGEPSRI